jgi:Zn-dependent protease
VLYALGDPLSFVLLLVSFVVAVTVHGWVSAVAADRSGDRRPRAEGRLRLDPRRHVDPFGAIAALLAGFGWARPLEPAGRRQPRGLLVATCLAGPAVNLALAAAALIGYDAATGHGPLVAAAVLRDGFPFGDAGERGLLLFGLMNLYVGLLSLVPLPPLDGGRLLFGLAPRTRGWQQAEHYLVDQNIGLAAALLLMLLPLGGPQPVLPAVLDDVARPLVRLVTGG